MKTFTLRITEVEAIALERLAYVNKCSKNDLLRSLICGAYCDLDPHAVALEDELLEIPFVGMFPFNVCERSEGTDTDISKIIRSIDYALKKAESEGITDEDITRLEMRRDNVINDYLK